MHDVVHTGNRLSVVVEKVFFFFSVFGFDLCELTSLRAIEHNVDVRALAKSQKRLSTSSSKVRPVPCRTHVTVVDWIAEPINHR